MSADLTTIYVLFASPAPTSTNLLGIGVYQWFDSLDEARTALGEAVSEDVTRPLDSRRRLAIYELKAPAALTAEDQEAAMSDFIEDNLFIEEPTEAALYDTHPMLAVRVVRTQRVLQETVYTGHIPREMVARAQRDATLWDLGEYVLEHLAAGEVSTLEDDGPADIALELLG